jgi:hypothetical protein
MHEGWQGDEYLILFDQAESAGFSASYEIDKYLPGHTILGLKGWDDFVVKRPDGLFATVPTVPMAAEYSAALETRIDPGQLRPDERFRGKVKWYRKPIVFGGDPADPSNIAWVPPEAHIELVRFWNGVFRRLRCR